MHQSLMSPARAMLSLGATFSLLAGASSALADSVEIVGLTSASTENLGKFLGSLDYTPAGDGTGTLVVSLANISPAGNDGFITGFLYNVDCDDPALSIVLQPGSTHPFEFADGSGAPFGGDYMAGAALGGSFLGGGNPNQGIAVGETGVFTFLVTTEQADDLTVASFLEGPYAQNFIVRFRGFEDGGSDKVPATTYCPCDYNFDGVVDSGDLGIVLAAWGQGPGSPYDANGDGIVDGGDLGLFLLCWRQCPQG